MYYVYVLKSLKDLKLYIGRSEDLRRRFKEHQAGKVVSTKYRRPFVLVGYESFKNKSDAVRREGYFKTTKGRSTIHLMFRDSLK